MGTGRLRLTVASLLVLGVVPTLTSAHADNGCASVRQHGAWTSISAPDNPVWPDPSGPGRLFMSMPSTTTHKAGGSLERSTDFGCTWQTVLSTPGPTDVSPAGGNALGLDPIYSIAQLVVPVMTTTPAHQIVYALLEDSTTNQNGEPVVPDVVAVSTDDGAAGSWQLRSPTIAAAATSTAPACSYGSRFVAAPSDPRTLYLLCPSFGTSAFAQAYVWNDTGANLLFDNVSWYVSHDAGSSWTLASRPVDGSSDPGRYGPSSLIGIAVDPTHPEQVWMATWNSYPGPKSFIYFVLMSRSTDGARTFRDVTTLAPPHPEAPNTSAGGFTITKPPGTAAPEFVMWADQSYVVQPGTTSASTHFIGWLVTSADGGHSWRSTTTKSFGAVAADGEFAGVTPFGDAGKLLVVAGGGAMNGLWPSPGSCGTPLSYRTFSYDPKRGRATVLAPPTLGPGTSISALWGLDEAAVPRRPTALTEGVYKSCDPTSTAPATTFLLSYSGGA